MPAFPAAISSNSSILSGGASRNRSVPFTSSVFQPFQSSRLPVTVISISLGVNPLPVIASLMSLRSIRSPDLGRMVTIPWAASVETFSTSSILDSRSFPGRTRKAVRSSRRRELGPRSSGQETASQGQRWRSSQTRFFSFDLSPKAKNRVSMDLIDRSTDQHCQRSEKRRV